MNDPWRRWSLIFSSFLFLSSSSFLSSLSPLGIAVGGIATVWRYSTRGSGTVAARVFPLLLLVASPSWASWAKAQGLGCRKKVEISFFLFLISLLNAFFYRINRSIIKPQRVGYSYSTHHKNSDINKIACKQLSLHELNKTGINSDAKKSSNDACLAGSLAALPQ